MKKLVPSLIVLAGLLGLAAGPAPAAEWPTKPVTVLVPWATGGMADVTSRLIAEKLKEKLGQPMLVSNQGGAGGITGMRALLGAKPDGYTLGAGAISSALSAPFLLDSPPFDLKKVAYVGSFATQARMLFTPLGRPYKTWEELVAYARQNPGSISIGFGASQPAMEVFKSIMKKEGLKFKLVMFKSGGEASTAMLGGHIDLVETGSGTPVYQSARQGQLLPLINLAPDKDANYPELKRVGDLGYPFAATSDYGLAYPAGVPEPIRAKAEQALKEITQDKKVQETILTMGLTPRFLSGAEYGPLVQKVVDDTPKLAEFVKDVK